MPAPDFIGRGRELRLLDGEWDRVRSTGRGAFVLVRGRRRVGKTRLVEEFLRRRKARRVAFFAATKGRPPDREIAAFRELVAASEFPAAALVEAGTRFDTWDAALRAIAASSDRDEPSVVVVDELPYLLEGDPSVEGSLQTAWDRSLEGAPVLLIVIGSDLSMMSALNEYGRPLFDRPTRTLHVSPLSPSELAAMLGLEARVAWDAYLVIGGFPLLALSWGRARDMGAFLRRELADPTAPVIVSGERMVAAEFPPQAQARQVLSAIGSGETTFKSIGIASGVPRQSLERALGLLIEKKVVKRILPLSSRSSRDARYQIVDSYLRFWLRFIEPGVHEIERGRGELVVERMMARWSEYRGKAIEPLVREAVTRMLPSPRFGDAAHVGAWWTRNGSDEVDLVGASSPERPLRIAFIGSIKWRERSPFAVRDLADLAAALHVVPGCDSETRLVAVSRSGFRARDLHVRLAPEDLLRAWKRES